MPCARCAPLVRVLPAPGGRRHRQRFGTAPGGAGGRVDAPAVVWVGEGPGGAGGSPSPRAAGPRTVLSDVRARCPERFTP